MLHVVMCLCLTASCAMWLNEKENSYARCLFFYPVNYAEGLMRQPIGQLHWLNYYIRPHLYMMISWMILWNAEGSSPYMRFGKIRYPCWLEIIFSPKDYYYHWIIMITGHCTFFRMQ